MGYPMLGSAFRTGGFTGQFPRHQKLRPISAPAGLARVRRPQNLSLVAGYERFASACQNPEIIVEMHQPPAIELGVHGRWNRPMVLDVEQGRDFRRAEFVRA